MSFIGTLLDKLKGKAPEPAKPSGQTLEEFGKRARELNLPAAPYPTEAWTGRHYPGATVYCTTGDYNGEPAYLESVSTGVRGGTRPDIRRKR